MNKSKKENTFSTIIDIKSNFHYEHDTRVKRSKIRCKFACKRICELGTRQKHDFYNSIEQKVCENNSSQIKI